MKESTARFFRLMEEQNQRIAAREAEAKEPKVGLDPIRIRSDAERRERLGRLRARTAPKGRGPFHDS